MKRAAWMVFQAAAIAGLMWLQVTGGPPDKTPPIVFLLLVNVVIVAFLTALLTRAADRLTRSFRRRPIHQVSETQGEGLGLGARGRLPGNLPE